MVDIAKIRKKAKSGERRAPEDKLQRFLAEAGTKRFAPSAPVETPTDQVELLTFILGGEQYAIDIDRIAEIVSVRPPTPVPNVDRSIVGIISVRGSIVTMVDVRAKLKQPPAKQAKDARIIIIRDGNGLLGFEVDRVLRPAKFDRSSIEPQPVVHADEESDFIRGVVRGPSALTIVLDLAKLLQ
jgi:chemotaxis signal transduction protein